MPAAWPQPLPPQRSKTSHRIYPSLMPGNATQKVPNVVWLGPRGAGKKTALQAFLAGYCHRIGQPYNIQMKHWQLQGGDGEGEISTSVDDTASSKNEKKGLIYEVSRIHKAFDVARMSLQDKNYVQAIVENFRGTSNILLGEGAGASHILVLYHAHLLSEESVILLQELLEKHTDTVTLLFTSEYPLSGRLADWFLEISVAGPDHAYEDLRAAHPGLPAPSPADGQGDAWIRFFEESFDKWRAHLGRPWTMEDVVLVRQWVYTCMQRNLRWCDMIIYWTQAIQRKFRAGRLTAAEAAAAYEHLARADTGGGFVMLPSYRIPVAWEEFMLGFLGCWAGA